MADARRIKPSQDADLLTVEGDINGPATAERITGAALERFGRIDTLVNGEILHIDGGQVAGH